MVFGPPADIFNSREEHERIASSSRRGVVSVAFTPSRVKVLTSGKQEISPNLNDINYPDRPEI